MTSSATASDRLQVVLAGETCELRAARTLYWPRERTLFVADTHWGKIETFRAASVPLPAGLPQRDLARLSREIQQTRAERLIVLGDLLHARAGRSPSLLEEVTTWRRAHGSLAIDLIQGNHDRHAGPLQPEWQIGHLGTEQRLGPFLLRHDPAPSPDGHVLAGHLHPAIRLHGPARQRLKLPCFWSREEMTVLPAFSTFVDGLPIRPQPTDHIYALTNEGIFPFSAELTPHA